MKEFDNQMIKKFTKEFEMLDQLNECKMLKAKRECGRARRE